MFKQGGVEREEVFIGTMGASSKKWETNYAAEEKIENE